MDAVLLLHALVVLFTDDKYSRCWCCDEEARGLAALLDEAAASFAEVELDAAAAPLAPPTALVVVLAPTYFCLLPPTFVATKDGESAPVAAAPFSLSFDAKY